MSPLERVHLHKIFNCLDKNGDGIVSIDELLRLLNVIGFRANRDEFELLIGGNGLNYVDFVLFYETLTDGGVFEQEIRELGRRDDSLERDLRRVFGVFDLDDDGFISCEDLRVTLSRLGFLDECCGEDCRPMIEVYDANSDGLLDFEEFKNMMLVVDR